MRKTLVVVFFCLSIVAASAATHCIFRVHAQANANDGEAFAQPIRSLTGKDVFIEKIPWISERDVAGFYPYRAADGSYGALIQLDDHGRTVLDTLSLERRGQTLFVFLNARPLTELLIDKRVTDGRIFLPSGLTRDDLQRMGKDWKILGRKKK